MRACCALVVAGTLATPAMAQDLRVEGTFWADSFPQARGAAAETQQRVILNAEGDTQIGDVTLRFDVTGFASSDRSAETFIDPVIDLSLSQVDGLSFGMQRIGWALTDTPLADPLVAPNLMFGVGGDLDGVAQPGMRYAFDLSRTTRMEIVAQFDLRTSPLPQAADRNGFGLDVVEQQADGDLGQGALALRLSGSGAALDWSGYVFHGVSRMPTLVPTAPTQITAFHDEVTQIGVSLDAAPGDWRVYGEAAYRWDGRDVTGARVDHGLATLGAEYQYFAALGGTADVILGAELRWDGRGSRADLPFSNGAALGVTFVQSAFLGLEAEYLVLYDSETDALGHDLRVTKPILETPFLALELRGLAFDDAGEPGVVTVFEDDSRYSLGLRMAF